MKKCIYCGEEIYEGQDYYPYSYDADYCSWECMVAHAKAGDGELIEEIFWETWWEKKMKCPPED